MFLFAAELQSRLQQRHVSNCSLLFWLLVLLDASIEAFGFFQREHEFNYVVTELYSPSLFVSKKNCIAFEKVKKRKDAKLSEQV